jgi:transposase
LLISGACLWTPEGGIPAGIIEGLPSRTVPVLALALVEREREPEPVLPSTAGANKRGAIEITLPNGTRLNVDASVNEKALARVLRDGFDGLAAKVQQMIGADPFSGHLFIFRGKRGDYFKGLYWDGSGLWPIAKRLEKGRFVWPPIINGAMTLTPAQFSVLVEAMDWRRTIAPPVPAYPMLIGQITDGRRSLTPESYIECPISLSAPPAFIGRVDKKMG